MSLTISNNSQLYSNIMPGAYTTESSDGWGMLSTESSDGWGILSTNQQEDTSASSDISSIYQQEDTYASSDISSIYQQEDTYAPSDILSIYQQEDTSAPSDILSIYQQQDTSASLTEEMSAGLESGAAAEVSDGSVTLSDSEGTKSLEIAPRDSLAVLESGEEGMIISNETTGEAIDFERGETVEVAGNGQFEMFASESSDLLGITDRIRLETGESAVLTDEGEGLVLSENNYTGEISVSEAGSSVNIAGDSGEQLTLANFDGESLSFNSGDEAEVRKTEEGLVFENNSTGETLAMQSGDTLSAYGEAELSIGNGWEVEGGDAVEASVTSTEATLENTPVRESVPVAAGDTESTSDLSLLSGYSSPQTAQMSLFGSLVSELI